MTNSTYNFTVELTGYDVYADYNKTSIVFFILPNTNCTANLNYTIDCIKDQYCSFTVLQSMFNELEEEELAFHLWDTTGTEDNWILYSDFNQTLYGVPRDVGHYNMTVEAIDLAGLTCNMTIMFYS